MRLRKVIIITGAFMLIEVAGGLISGSLALLADAAHMLTDVAALGLAWLAARIARRPPDRMRTFGYHRAQIISAFVNGLAALGLSAWIVAEAVRRLFEPVKVMGEAMLVVAVIGLAVNIWAFMVLHRGSESNLNMRGALVHVMGDMLGSVAAIVASVVILWSGWTAIDPLLSMLVAVIILRSGWYVVRQSAHILLEGAPADVDEQHLRRTIVEEVPGVCDVHHVHIWSLTPEQTMVTLHANVSEDADYMQTLRAIKLTLSERFRVHHATVQIEYTHCVDHS